MALFKATLFIPGMPLRRAGAIVDPQSEDPEKAVFPQGNQGNAQFVTKTDAFSVLDHVFHRGSVHYRLSRVNDSAGSLMPQLSGGTPLPLSHRFESRQNTVNHRGDIQ